jgi:hypothetical protein
MNQYSSPDLSTRDPEAIRDQAFKYMKKWLVTRKEFDESVDMIDFVDTDMARVRYEVAERDFVEKIIPASASHLPAQKPVSQDDYDPWAVNPMDIADLTRRVITCTACKGTQKVACPNCNGTSQAKCFGCNGSGLVPAKRGGLKNCPNCRGKGTRKCEACKKGEIDCATCKATGKQEHWLEIKHGRLEFTFHKVPDRQKKFDWPTFEQVEARDPLLPFDVLMTWTGENIEKAPSEVQDWLNEPELIPGTNKRTMRIQKIELQVVRLPMVMLTYDLAGKKGGLFIKSKDMTVLPTASDKQPLQRRLAFMAGGALLALIVGSQFASGYAGKHLFFSQTWVSGMMSFLTLGMAGLTVPTAALLCQPKDSSLRPLLPKFGGAVGAILVLLLLLPLLGQPSVSHATQLLNQGKTVAGFRELDAAIKTKHNETEAMAAFDKYHVSQALGMSSIQAVKPFLSTNFFIPESKNEVINHLQQVAEKELLPPKDSQLFVEALSQLPPEVLQHSEPLKKAAWGELAKTNQKCMAKNDIGCLQANLNWFESWGASPVIQKAAQKNVLAYYQTRLNSTWAPAIQTSHYPTREKTCQTVTQLIAAAPAQLKSEGIIKNASFTQTCQTWKTEEVARQKQIAKEAAERKTYEAKIAQERAQAEDARRQAEEEVQRMRDLYPNGALMCNDGSFSPTCSCPGKRGCCSHHGGVAGCKYF